MPIGSLSTYVIDYDSDHTYQTATIEAATPKNASIILKGMTLNMLNRCHSAAVGKIGFSNNAFDLDETDDYYLTRKKNQLKFLWNKIIKDELDFVFLQEVDIFSHSPLPDYVKAFFNNLHEHGWGVVHSDKDDTLKQPMVTLYKSGKLKFVSKRALFKTSNNVNTGLEAEFIEHATNEHLCLTNIHLDYNTDHRRDTHNYQLAQIAKDMFTIIGGDVNPHGDVTYQFFAGDENIATCIAALIAEDESAGNIHAKASNPQNDGIGASPYKGKEVIIRLSESVYFVKAKKGYYMLRSISSAKGGAEGAKFKVESSALKRVLQAKNAPVQHQAHAPAATPKPGGAPGSTGGTHQTGEVADFTEDQQS